MRKTSNTDNSVFGELRRQKEEVLRNIRKEQKLIQIYSDALTSPLRHRDSIKPQTPIKSLFNTFSTASYTFRLIKSVFSVLKLMR